MAIIGERNMSLRLAYVTLYDPNDPEQWSGIGHAILQSLRQQQLQVTAIGPLRCRLGPLKRIAESVHAVASRGYYEFQRERIVGWDYARQISAKMVRDEFDVVLSAGAPIAVSWLSCSQPIAIWSGATFSSLIHHYGFVHGNCQASIRAGHRMERAALTRARLLLFASEWAAGSAVRDYGADPTKIRIVPFGANLAHPPCRGDVMHAIDTRSREVCSLISVGVEWERKGMARAVDLSVALNERGVPTELRIVGCEPPRGRALPAHVRLCGHIDKRSSGGEQRLGALMAASHFHVLLSTAECFGIAYCEANAWGVPNIASDVGGVPSAVRNGEGGWRFSISAPVEEIADFIAAIHRDQDRYGSAARRARHEYEQRLNWATAGAAARVQMETISGARHD
jgi:glycosyltransferase involved in cell wall biosynthesis